MIKIPKGEDIQFTLHPDVERKMAENPELAESMRDMMARMRQAQDGIAAGLYATFDEAMAAQGVEANRISEDEMPEEAVAAGRDMEIIAAERERGKKG